jgi:hypothetical protein
MENDILKRMEEARRQSEQTAIELVHIELTVALTNIKVAKTRKALNLEIAAYVRLASHALGVAEKMMWKFRVRHNEFNEMVANAERARMELEALANETDRPKAKAQGA